MVKIRPRRPAGAPDVPEQRWHDDDALEGADAFGPADDPDPFGRAFAESRRPAHAARSDDRGPRIGLLLACLVLLAGVLAAALGLADDDDDVTSVASTSSTTSTTRPRVTTTSSVTSTTVLTSTSLGVATTTSAVGPTVTTTVRPTTTLVAPTTTIPANQPLTISIVFPSEPVVGDNTAVITLTDPDAIPTSNCFVVEVDDEVLLADPCNDEPCPEPDDPSIEPVGGTRTVDIPITFTTGGQHTVSVTGRSGVPECRNRFADSAEKSETVTVRPAD